MKKLVAWTLAVVLVMSLSTTAFATDYNPVGDKGMTVTYSVAPTYTVTIPTNVAIDGNATTISAENVVVEKGQYVSVSLAADNDFTVATAEGAELAYTVTANGEAVAAGGEILAVNPTNGKTGTATITFDIDESAIKYAGTYTGTATFTSAVKDVPVTTISFTIDAWTTLNCTATEGMTWAEYAESDNNEYVMVWSGGRVVVGEGWDIYLSEEPVMPTDVIQNNASYVANGGY